MKAIEQYFHVILISMLNKVVLTFTSVAIQVEAVAHYVHNVFLALNLNILNNVPTSSLDLNPFPRVGDRGIDGEEGSHIIIRCNAPDSFPHRTIKWTKGGNQLPSQSSRRAISQEGDLHFSFLEKSDAGVYVCTVTNVFITKKVVRTVSLFISPGT